MTRRCEFKCLYAKGKKCRCICNGLNHGYFARANQEDDDTVLLNHIPEILAIFQDKSCVSCGHRLDMARILGYPHHNGIYVSNYSMRLWVYAECFKCKYQNSWLKVSQQPGWLKHDQEKSLPTVF